MVSRFCYAIYPSYEVFTQACINTIINFDVQVTVHRDKFL